MALFDPGRDKTGRILHLVFTAVAEPTGVFYE
jgi:hypothetical protein